jgi:hypothetical protein
MNDDIESLISEIESWLQEQEVAESGSPRWYALGSLRQFLYGIMEDNSPLSIAKAGWVLSHRLSDQYDWSPADCNRIGTFLARARKLERS